MPVVHDPEVTPEEKLSWLSDYQKTYLERDVADLAALRELEPFVRAQKALALRSGGLVNFSDLARDAGVAPGTARRFLRYLELSYQVLALPAWHANASKRLTKRPKVHLVDPGVQRSILGRSGEVTGDEFESAVVAEIFKQVRTAGLRVALHHLRTHDGREVDLLIESDRWVVAIEVKMARTVAAVHARNLTSLEAILGRPVRKGIVLSRDPVVRELSPEVIALPAAWALGPCCEQVRRRATPIPRRHRRLPHP
jgi:predicted AAA+ superfamily ATPase